MFIHCDGKEAPMLKQSEWKLLISGMASNRQIDIEIDKLTRSVENAITGDSIKLKFYLLHLKT